MMALYDCIYHALMATWLFILGLGIFFTRNEDNYRFQVIAICIYTVGATFVFTNTAADDTQPTQPVIYP